MLDELVGLTDPLHVIDEMAIHGELSAASELAGLVRATHRAAAKPEQQNTVDLISIFYWLKRAVLANERGAYSTTRGMLARCEDMFTQVSDDEVRTQLEAAAELVECRLLQLLVQPRLASVHLDRATNLLGVLRPPGIELMEARNRMHEPGTHADSVLDKDASSDLHPDNIYGGGAPSYRHYLKGYLAMNRGDLVQARELLERSLDLLKPPLADHYSRTREIFTRICLGRVEARQPQPSERSVLILQQARWASHELRFHPGSYIAHKYLIEANRPQDLSQTQRHRELWLLARESKVAVYILEAACRYAESLLEDGRPNKANYVASTARTEVANDPFSSDLKEHPLSVRLAELLARTADARNLAIEPRSAWGLTDYAVRELAFVNGVLENGGLASASGSPYSGRRMLLRRIARARGQADVVEISGTHGVANTLLEIREGLKRGAVLLVDVDRWQVNLQRSVANEIRGRPTDCRHRLYATLQAPIVESLKTAHLDIGLSRELCDALKHGSFEVLPLNRRLQDIVILARGILIRELEKRATSQATDTSHLRRLFFKGAACAEIRRAYSTLPRLYQAMATLAKKLDLRVDVVEQSDGRLEIPSEALDRHLPARAVTAGQLAVRNADAELIQHLAIEHDGQISHVAAAFEMSRQALYRAWRSRGVFEIWKEQPAVRSHQRASRPRG